MDCSPILHIEAHGDENGIYGLGENGNEREIAWEELTEPFQNLNVATRCNLLVIVAACIGNAGVKSFVRSPRAPAIALIGPANNISPKSVLDATKELYRIIVNGHEHLDDIIAGMSSESGEVPFVDHRFTEICYEALVSELIKSARPDEKRKRRVIASERLAQRGYSSEQVTQILDSRPELGVAETQQIWDEMFCLDLCPENRERFGLDMMAIYQAAEALSCN
jgi:hypothetical protein